MVAMRHDICMNPSANNTGFNKKKLLGQASMFTGGTLLIWMILGIQNSQCGASEGCLEHGWYLYVPLFYLVIQWLAVAYIIKAQSQRLQQKFWVIPVGFLAFFMFALPVIDRVLWTIQFNLNK
jgi:hypothetical protein